MAGALLAIPVIITYWILKFVFNVVDGVLSPPIAQALGRNIPGLGLLALIVMIYLLGLIGANVLGRRVIHTVERAVARIPMVGSVYTATRSLSDTIVGGKTQELEARKGVLVEYPGKGLWTLGFLTSVMTVTHTGRMAAIYFPSAPTPHTGWTTIVPVTDVLETDIPVSEAMAFILTVGVMSPRMIVTRPLTLKAIETLPVAAPASRDAQRIPRPASRFPYLPIGALLRRARRRRRRPNP